jgi:transposase-like protein
MRCKDGGKMQNNTRRRWAREERVKIVLEGMESPNVQDICRKYQVAPGQWYRWKSAFLEKGEEGLEDHRMGGRYHKRNPLEVENKKLVELVGRQALMLEMQKKLLDRLHGRLKRIW